MHSSYGHTDALLNQPAIAPLGEAKPNTQIFRESARRMGFADDCFDDDDQALCRQAYGDAIDFDQLLRDGYFSLATAEAPFADGSFPTPSGRCEFFSERLAARGLDGLPDYLPNHESPGVAGLPFPLAMISPPARHFLNSSFVSNVASLRAKTSEPSLEMHAAAAERATSSTVIRFASSTSVANIIAGCTSAPKARPGFVDASASGGES